MSLGCCGVQGVPGLGGEPGEMGYQGDKVCPQPRPSPGFPAITTDRYTDRQIHRQTDRQAHKQTDSQTHTHVKSCVSCLCPPGCHWCPWTSWTQREARPTCKWKFPLIKHAVSPTVFLLTAVGAKASSVCVCACMHYALGSM